jgi:hypothetical protein
MAFVAISWLARPHVRSIGYRKDWRLKIRVGNQALLIPTQKSTMRYASFQEQEPTTPANMGSRYRPIS